MKLFKPPRIAKWIFPRYTWRFSVLEPTIFLTFDDGPHPDITPFVLDLLHEYRWKATFFCVGENMQRYPELVERIEKEGHGIGNHTMNHLKGIYTETETYFANFQASERVKTTSMFRPPYGRMTPKQAREIAKSHQIIMWSWLSYDYDLGISTEKILSAADRVKPGDILVLHDNPKIAERQRELLPELFKKMETLGLKSLAISSGV